MGNIPGSSAEVRFANPQDGWIVASTDTAPYTELWATHNGGSRWEAVTLPAALANASISDLETSGGEVYASFCGDPVRIGASPVTVNAWTPSPTTLQIGAGPVCGDQMVLQGADGWLMNVDRTVIDGARLADGAWSPWTPPCEASGGPGELAASDPNHLVAVCDGGEYGGPAGVLTSLSTDGGSTFVPGPQSLPQDDYGPSASPSPGVIILASSEQGDLLGSFDGGEKWSPVYSPLSSEGWTYLGFTTSTQGVAIAEGGTMVMTFDGGHAWAPVRFPSTSS